MVLLYRNIIIIVMRDFRKAFSMYSSNGWLLTTRFARGNHPLDSYIGKPFRKSVMTMIIIFHISLQLLIMTLYGTILLPPGPEIFPSCIPLALSSVDYIGWEIAWNCSCIAWFGGCMVWFCTARFARMFSMLLVIIWNILMFGSKIVRTLISFYFSHETALLS